MSAKLSPEWKFVVYPHSAIQRRHIDGYVVADMMGDIVAGDPSSWGGILSRGMVAGGQWSDWASLDSGFTLTNVGFTRFQPDGTVSTAAAKNEQGPGGFHVLPRATPLAALGGDLGTLGALEETGVGWDVTKGTFRATPALNNQSSTGLYNTGETDSEAVAATHDKWAAGTGCVGDLSFLLNDGEGGNDTPEYLWQVSANLRWALRVGRPIALERRSVTVAGSVATDKWGVWRTFDKGGAFDARNTRCRLSLHVLGNRLVAQAGDETLWLVDSTTDATRSQTPAGAVKTEPYERVADMSTLLGGVPLTVSAKGLRGRLDLSRLDFTDHFGNPGTGTVARSVKVNTATGTALSPYGVGHQPNSATMPAAITRDGDTLNYSVTLTATTDGAQSPMLSHFNLVYKPAWVAGTGDGIDVTRFVASATVNHAHPPAQAGCEGTIVIDNHLIEGDANAAARALLCDYAPVEISGRWKYADGSRGDYKGLARGYLLGTDAKQDVWQDATTTFTVRSKMARLRGNNARVDGSCPALDYYLAEKSGVAQRANAPGEGTDFVTVLNNDGSLNRVIPVPPSAQSYYGGEAARDIVEMFLGSGIASNFNGNGDPLRYLADNQPPLLSFADLAGSWLPVATAFGQNLTSASLTMQGRLIMMPPFGQDAWTWIESFAADEFSIFTEGKPDRSQMWMDLMYGAREQILRTALLHTISGTDVNLLLAQMSSYETKPESDINRVLVWGKPFGQEAPMAPALMQGEAVLTGNTERSPYRTWPRTLIVESPFASTPARAQVLAYATMAEASGAQFVYPRYTFLGDADCLTGDVFVAQDAGILPTQGFWFRAERVEHEYKSSGDVRSWNTTSTLRTMSLAELNSFKRLNNLPIPVYP